MDVSVVTTLGVEGFALIFELVIGLVEIAGDGEGFTGAVPSFWLMRAAASAAAATLSITNGRFSFDANVLSSSAGRFIPAMPPLGAEASSDIEN